MLQVQEYLREKTARMSSGAAISALNDQFHIRTAYSPDRSLVTLNYDQIDSPKHHPISRECRGLTLEFGTWEVVARSFTRFFNAGECPAEEAKFDWGNFVAESKEDGSLVVLYKHGGIWRVNTRGSFGLGEIQPGSGITWEEGFYLALNEKGTDVLPDNYSYVFEFCSRWNKVVRDYPVPTLFLLTAFEKSSGAEMHESALDAFAIDLRVRRPDQFQLESLSDIAKFVNDQEATFEGCVLRDRNGLRLKVKNKAYVALHHLKDNGNVFASKNLIPLILRNEHAEVLAAFPEAAEKLADVAEKMGAAMARAMMAWDAAKSKKTQKEFALVVNACGGPLKSALFEARKSGTDPLEVLRKSEDLLVKALA